MQVKQDMSPELVETLATNVIRRNTKSLLRSLTFAARERLAEVERRHFEARLAYRQAQIECENAVEHIFDDMNKI